MINAVSFSPDSRLIASASSDATITLWSIQSVRRVRTLLEHSKSVDAVAFSPNVRFIVSKSALPQIILWAIDATRRWEMLQSLLLHGRNWNGPDTQNFLYSLDANDHWTLNRDKTGSHQAHMNGRCTRVQGDTEDAGLCHSADATMRTGSILSQTRNVTIFRSSDEGDQCRTFQPSAQIGTFTCKPNGQLAALVFTNSTMILWAGHPAEILYATLASEATGVPLDAPMSLANYPSNIADTTKDRITLISFSPDSSQVACIIR
jgi:WD40 repeat protein